MDDASIRLIESEHNNNETDNINKTNYANSMEFAKV